MNKTIEQIEEEIILKYVHKSQVNHLHHIIHNIPIHSIVCHMGSNRSIPNNKPNILMVHGYGGNCMSFIKMTDYLTPKYNLYMIDLPGFGRSGTSDKLQSGDIDTILDLYSDLLKEYILQIDKSILVFGHSLGAYISIHMVNKYPKIVKKMILLNPAGILPVNQTSVYKYSTWMFKYDIPGSIFRYVSNNKPLYKLLLGTNRISLHKIYKAMLFSSPTYTSITKAFIQVETINGCIHVICKRPMLAQLSSLTIPIRLIYGKKDLIVDKNDGEYIHKLTDIPVYTINNLGHNIKSNYDGIEELVLIVGKFF